MNTKDMPKLARESLKCDHKWEDIGGIGPYCHTCGSALKVDGSIIPPVAYAQTSEKGWEEIFDELDKNELWSEICDKHAPGGMFEIDDDSLQSLIAQVASNLIASERSKLLHAIKGEIESRKAQVEDGLVHGVYTAGYQGAIKDILRLLEAIN